MPKKSKIPRVKIPKAKIPRAKVPKARVPKLPKIPNINIDAGDYTASVRRTKKGYNIKARKKKEKFLGFI